MTLLDKIVEGVCGTLALNREQNDLSRLTDRELKDIGLTRYDALMLAKSNKTGV